MFSGIRQGNIIYLLDKSNLTLTIAEVVKVSNPYTLLQKQQGNKMQVLPAYMQPQGQEQFVDIIAKSKEQELNLEELPATHTSYIKNNIFVCDNLEAINNEIDSSERSSKIIIDSIPYHEKAIKTYRSMKMLVNPQFAKEKEQEEKIGMLEERMGNIDDKLNKMFDLLSDTLERKSKKTKED